MSASNNEPDDCADPWLWLGIDPQPIKNCRIPIGDEALVFIPAPTDEEPDGGAWDRGRRVYADLWIVRGWVLMPSHFLPLPPKPPRLPWDLGGESEATKRKRQWSPAFLEPSRN